MHEWITVYVDDEDVLRADHNLKFHGLPFLNLHYKMTEKYGVMQEGNKSKAKTLSSATSQNQVTG
jgi:hypothetical protein